MSSSSFIPRRFVVAEFKNSDTLLEGTRKMREKGHHGVDTHTPYPVHGLEEALGIKRVKVPTIVLLAGITGVCLAYGMMYFMNKIDFPINVANRPPHSAPAFIPITFELMVLLGGTSAFFGLMGLLKLPAALPSHLRVGGVRAGLGGRVLPVGRGRRRRGSRGRRQ